MPTEWQPRHGHKTFEKALDETVAEIVDAVEASKKITALPNVFEDFIKANRVDEKFRYILPPTNEKGSKKRWERLGVYIKFNGATLGHVAVMLARAFGLSGKPPVDPTSLSDASIAWAYIVVRTLCRLPPLGVPHIPEKPQPIREAPPYPPPQIDWEACRRMSDLLVKRLTTLEQDTRTELKQKTKKKAQDGIEPFDYFC